MPSLQQRLIDAMLAYEARLTTLGKTPVCQGDHVQQDVAQEVRRFLAQIAVLVA